MDCCKTKIFFKEWRRMCEFHTKSKSISECLLRTKNSCEGCYHVDVIFITKERLDEILAIVQEWSDLHPIEEA